MARPEPFCPFTFDKTKVECDDGQVRTFHQTNYADTFFSVPGFVYASKNGTKARVYGYLTSGDEDKLLFHAYRYRQNFPLVQSIDKLFRQEGTNKTGDPLWVEVAANG